MTRSAGPIYAMLLAAWAVVAVWQTVEHRRVRQSARTTLIHRAKDISTTVGVVMRSQRRFGGIISRDRIESAIGALIKPGDLTAIALLNDDGEIVASAGAPIAELDPQTSTRPGEYWEAHAVTLLNLVDLGTNLTTESQGPQTTIVLPRDQMFPQLGTNRPVRPSSESPPPDGPTPGDRPRPPSETSAGQGPSPSLPGNETNRPPRMRGWPGRRGGDGGPSFERPFWMSEQEYKEALEKKGVHSFLLVLSTDSMLATVRQDLWLRSLVCALALVACGGVGLAWRNLSRSADLEVRLVRAAELNARLKEMNFAAAGLAHETRNPLNIIRGLAQLISRQDDASPEIRAKCRDMINEADRLTAQLNEFINYSRPREVRRAPVALSTVAQEVARALGSDIEDKAIRLEISLDLPLIEADEQLLRQALFNLILNAIQAVERGGEIRVSATRPAQDTCSLEIADNGPGVPPEHRTEIFKPYFTTHAEGTGLGLAIVQQIVLAHGWEIACLPREPRGARFRIDHIRPATTSAS